MNRKIVALGAVVLGMLTALAATARADDYKADPVHSFVVFDVHHLARDTSTAHLADPKERSRFPLTTSPRPASISASMSIHSAPAMIAATMT